jgi:hypothetical protein
MHGPECVCVYVHVCMRGMCMCMRARTHGHVFCVLTLSRLATIDPPVRLLQDNKLNDGFPCTPVHSNDPTIKIFEKGTPFFNIPGKDACVSCGPPPSLSHSRFLSFPLSVHVRPCVSLCIVTGSMHLCIPPIGSNGIATDVQRIAVFRLLAGTSLISR